MKRLLFSNILLLLICLTVSGQTSGTKQGQEIIIETTFGNIELLLYDDTPLHRDNMIKLINEGFYNGQLFHRVINNFMIQGGDPHSVNAPKGQRLGNGGPGYQIPPEFKANHIHKKGALAAARQGDSVNPEKKSSGSQFYIVEGQAFSLEQLATLQSTGRAKALTQQQIDTYTTIGGSPHLDGDYTVFGEVTKGFDIIEAISNVAIDSSNRPLENIVYSIKLK